MPGLCSKGLCLHILSRGSDRATPTALKQGLDLGRLRHPQVTQFLRGRRGFSEQAHTQAPGQESDYSPGTLEAKRKWKTTL